MGPQLNLFELEDVELLVNEQEWEDVEFEVALDSGSIVNVCHPDDCPGYAITESVGSKSGQHFVVGDGGRLPNMGEWNLNLMLRPYVAAVRCGSMLRQAVAAVRRV